MYIWYCCKCYIVSYHVILSARTLWSSSPGLARGPCCSASTVSILGSLAQYSITCSWPLTSRSSTCTVQFYLYCNCSSSQLQWLTVGGRVAWLQLWVRPGTDTVDRCYLTFVPFSTMHIAHSHTRYTRTNNTRSHTYTYVVVHTYTRTHTQV